MPCKIVKAQLLKKDFPDNNTYSHTSETVSGEHLRDETKIVQSHSYRAGVLNADRQGRCRHNRSISLCLWVVLHGLHAAEWRQNQLRRRYVTNTCLVCVCVCVCVRCKRKVINCLLTR